MGGAHFIAGDWGTTHLRLYLCEAGGPTPPRILDARTGPGVSRVGGDFEATLFSLLGDWPAQYPGLPVILSGMVGSSLGWREAPYLPCPIAIDDIRAGGIRLLAGGLEITILAGLRATNPLGNPDLMRGEELQLLGWFASQSGRARGRHLIGLPGTHNKWAVVEEGRILTFQTGADR